MDKHLQAAHDLIADEASAFLKQINAICENGPFRKARKLPSTFSMFRGANDEFYEYAYFERTLEWYIRDLLINPILQGLLAIHGVTTLWPERKNYIRFSTEAVENVQPLEFVIETEHERVGIRYSGLDADEATELIARYELTRIIRIRWDEGRCNTIHEIYEEISPEDFFALYQMHEVYKFFCEQCVRLFKLPMRRSDLTLYRTFHSGTYLISSLNWIRNYAIFITHQCGFRFFLVQ